MKVRYKSNLVEGDSSKLNTHGLGEVVVRFPDGDMTSEAMSLLDIQLPDGKWKDMREAFRDRDAVPDNHQTRFAAPADQAERDRGYSW